jgi:prefoldin subunit 5
MTLQQKINELELKLIHNKEVLTRYSNKIKELNKRIEDLENIIKVLNDEIEYYKETLRKES